MASQLISSGDGGGISRHSSFAGAGLSGGHSGSSLLGIEDTWNETGISTLFPSGTKKLHFRVKNSFEPHYRQISNPIQLCPYANGIKTLEMLSAMQHKKTKPLVALIRVALA
ncbi:UNVERIFIED_CONTAM: hypothetical protein FKN15_066369 [Acipenser sinensis]